MRQGEPDGGKALPSSENLLKASKAAADLAERSQKAEPRELARRDPSPRRYLEAYARKATPPLEDPAVISRIDALQAEATVLREELRQADLQIQTAASESAAANADLRESRLRHQQWLRSMQEESGRLRRENKRLERSYHQAGLEERRVADLARSQPGTSEQKLASLKAACERLELENERLKQDLEAGQADLSSVRDVVAHAAPSRHQRSSPSIGMGHNKVVAAASSDSATRLQRDSSMPLLRRSFC